MRLRVAYRKTEPLRYIGTLDMQKIWERSLRRAELPVQYSKGFHPQPKIQLACPLPVGFLSDDEWMDFWIHEGYSFDQARQKLFDLGQPGIEVTGVVEVANNLPPLQNLTNICIYRVWPLGQINIAAIKASIETLLSEKKIERVRRDKPYDLRPLIHSLDLAVEDEHPVISMRLSARPGATGRPEEVLDAIGLDPTDARYLRTGTIFGVEK